MGHRGAAGLAPENTMAAFRQAASLGVPFELDIRFAGSGELIVLHDDALERVAWTQGLASERSLGELQALDGEAIPTLDQVFAEIAGDVVINVEAKSVKGTDNDALADALADAVEARGVVDQIVVTSFSPFFLAALRKRNPDIARGQIYGTFKDSELRWYERVLLRNLAFNRRALPDILIVEHVMVDARFLRKMHRRGYKVFAWTVNDRGTMERLLGDGIDGIITDHPDLLLEVMRARGMPTPSPRAIEPAPPAQATLAAEPAPARATQPGTERTPAPTAGSSSAAPPTPGDDSRALPAADVDASESAGATTTPTP